MPSSLEIERILRSAELRVTRPRIAVLSAVHAHPHADTNSIIGAVRDQLADVSHQAVYDVLQALTGAGLLRRIQPSGSLARYEARVADNHHHIVCRSCGSVADVDCAVGGAPCLTPSEAHGYAVDEAEVIYWGLCPECSENSGAAAPDRRPTPDGRPTRDGRPIPDHRPTPDSRSPLQARFTAEPVAHPKPNPNTH